MWRRVGESASTSEPLCSGWLRRSRCCCPYNGDVGGQVVAAALGRRDICLNTAIGVVRRLAMLTVVTGNVPGRCRERCVELQSREGVVENQNDIYRFASSSVGSAQCAKPVLRSAYFSKQSRSAEARY